jgi:hypothetical protein
MTVIKWMTTLTLLGTLAGVRGAWGAGCDDGRAKAAGKYARCIQREMANAYIGKLPAVQFGKCVTKYGATYARLPCAGARYVDNGDGTVTDNLTALMWEQKTDDATVHDKDNVYSWSASGTAADGTAYTAFLSTLNGGGFAGQHDWRLPTWAELLSITQPAFPACTAPPCIAPVFGPTVSSLYWSSSTYQTDPVYAWFVNFTFGGPLNYAFKASALYVLYVRAVRGGF